MKKTEKQNKIRMFLEWGQSNIKYQNRKTNFLYLKTFLIGNRAITLISLVITIIVLIILSSVGIYLSLGDNGIFKEIKQAKELYENAQRKENEELNELYSQVILATNSNSQVTINMKQLIDIVYPIGSIYISTSEVNPKGIIGGEWERYAEGRTLIGAGNGTDVNGKSMEFSINNEGGEYDHKISIAEMPSHNHEYTNGGDALVIYSNIDEPKQKNYGFSGINANGWWHGVNKATSPIKSNGNSEAHNNIQPYIVTYMWKRVK